jgi:hypothetical protein
MGPHAFSSFVGEVLRLFERFPPAILGRHVADNRLRPLPARHFFERSSTMRTLALTCGRPSRTVRACGLGPPDPRGRSRHRAHDCGTS